ncbi:MAG: glycosyltransferase family protein, partial [Chitinophagaceae bacterium]
MNIGFDAKRAFHNGTGLGHYSRTLITSLAKFFPEDHFFLFASALSNRFNFSGYSNMETVLPVDFISRQFPSLWRSRGILKDLKRKDISLFHGLSNEIPFGIQKTNILSLVTIHDLIFERFPSHYRRTDTWIYQQKFRYACKHANKV